MLRPMRRTVFGCYPSVQAAQLVPNPPSVRGVVVPGGPDHAERHGLLPVSAGGFSLFSLYVCNQLRAL